MGTVKKVLFVMMAILVMGVGAAFFYYKFEGEAPRVTVDPEVSFLGSQTSLTVRVADRRSGIERLTVRAEQEGTSIVLLSEEFAAGVHQIERLVEIVPSTLKFTEGPALLRIEAGDHSWRPGGNRTVIERQVTVDTRPPQTTVLSRFHYVNQGGAQLVVYRSSESLVHSGVRVGERWFPGYPLDDGHYLCFFAVPFDMTQGPSIRLEASDLAGNVSRAGFYYQIKAKKFRRDTITISDNFLQRVMPYFMDRHPELQGDLLDVFLKVNRELRIAHNTRITEVCKGGESRPLWSGPFLRLERAKPMAGFGDHRIYTYKGRQIDRQNHLGIDLASLAMSPVPAANRGRVIVADEMGIYGITVVLDHGCGVFSMYGHLSEAAVQPGDLVEKGQRVGTTGSTGLAGGDHLHFGMLVSGVFVNPIEWWDPHWIRDNVESKLALLQSGTG